MLQTIYHGIEHRTQIKMMLTKLGVEHPELAAWDFRMAISVNMQEPTGKRAIYIEARIATCVTIKQVDEQNGSIRSKLKQSKTSPMLNGLGIFLSAAAGSTY